MIATAKLLILALATSGVVAAGAVAHIPLEKAIEIHKNHLGPDSTMPDQCRKGQQNALDNLVANQERWLQDHEPIAQPEADQDEVEPAE